MAFASTLRRWLLIALIRSSSGRVTLLTVLYAAANPYTNTKQFE